MTPIAHETLTFVQPIAAPLSAVWAAFADSTQRATWSVPAGEAMVFDQSNFHVGGRDEYRCGPRQTLEFFGLVDYVQIVPETPPPPTDLVASSGQTLAIALVTWEFDHSGDSTLIRLTDQVTSFVGSGMIDGHRNGHAKALSQLRDFVEEAVATA